MCKPNLIGFWILPSGVHTGYTEQLQSGPSLNLYPLFSKMNNGLEVITQQLSYSEQPLHPSRSSQKLPNRLNLKRCASQVLWDVLPGAPQCSWYCGTEYKNILQSMMSSLAYYKIMSFSGQNFGAAGTTTLIAKTFPVYLEPDSPEVTI
jgi:hypothetical protein